MITCKQLRWKRDRWRAKGCISYIVIAAISNQNTCIHADASVYLGVFYVILQSSPINVLGYCLNIEWMLDIPQCKGLKLQASISTEQCSHWQAAACDCTQRTAAGNSYVNATQSGKGGCQMRLHLYYARGAGPCMLIEVACCGGGCYSLNSAGLLATAAEVSKSCHITQLQGP